MTDGVMVLNAAATKLKVACNVEGSKESACSSVV